MSLLNSKINSVEAEVLNLGEAKANTLFPTFQGTATFAGPVVLRDVVSFGSSSITGLTKTAVGLDQVNNTSDAAKPISTLQQAQFDLKATKLNPSFSGNATFAGPVAFNNSNITGLTKAMVGLDKVQNIDAAAYTDQRIQSLVSGAPALLDTITELATAINNDANYSTTITSLISTKANKSDVDSQLATFQPISSMGDYYKKSDSDAKFQTLAGMSNYYTKAETDNNYYTIGYLSNNYYTRPDILNLLRGYFTAAQITDSYYDRWTVDNYIDAKINASYVLEMMYNESGHQYFIAVDPTTSTTDAQFIINNAQKTPLIKFSTPGTKIYTDSGYNVAFINASSGNSIATYNPTYITYYVRADLYNTLTILLN